jgi:DNA-binding SARP family transcriptional activator
LAARETDWPPALGGRLRVALAKQLCDWPNPGRKRDIVTRELVIHPNQPVDFHLFGAVEMRCGERSIDLGGIRDQCLVAALLLANGRPVPREQLPDWIWDHAPETAPNELERLMARLRSRLASVGLGDALVARNGRCRLDVPADRVDVHQFAALVDAARSGDRQRTSELLRAALDLSAGEPMAGLNSARIISSRVRLVEERRRVELMFAKVEMELGHTTEQVPNLIQLFTEHPDSSDVAMVTMSALHRTNRRKEALAVFDEHHRRLEEAGLTMPKQVRDLQTHILNDDEGPRLANEEYGPTDDEAPGRAKHIAVQQNADTINYFADRVDATGAHFGPRYDRGSE